jgi:NAD(P)H dehydrogenase (quinone)
VAAQLQVVTGRRVSFHNETEDEAYASRAQYNAPAFEVEGWVTSYQSIEAGEMSLVSDDVERIIGRPAAPFARFLAAHPESYEHLVTR